jgi:hypothetical protein
MEDSSLLLSLTLQPMKSLYLIQGSAHHKLPDKLLPQEAHASLFILTLHQWKTKGGDKSKRRICQDETF